MSNRRNHRRKGPKNEKRTENGPTWEGRNPGKGCNSTHVARARRWWQNHARRVLRRTGVYGGRKLPDFDNFDGEEDHG